MLLNIKYCSKIYFIDKKFANESNLENLERYLERLI